MFCLIRLLLFRVLVHQFQRSVIALVRQSRECHRLTFTASAVGKQVSRTRYLQSGPPLTPALYKSGLNCRPDQGTDTGVLQCWPKNAVELTQLGQRNYTDAICLATTILISPTSDDKYLPPLNSAGPSVVKCFARGGYQAY